MGQPDHHEDMRRLEAVQKRLPGRAALIVDANQQWDCPTALRMGRSMESFGQFKALLTIRKASMSPPSSQAQPSTSR